MANNNVQLDIVTRNLKEVMGFKELETLLVNNSNIKAYWGTAPTGKIHVGYLVSLMKIVDLVNVGISVTILIADLHALLDDKKFAISTLDLRVEYYIQVITSALQFFNVDFNKITFIKGSSFQNTPEYNLNILRLSSITSLRTSIHSGSEVTKKSNNPMVSSLIYPILQTLDEIHLGTDIQLGGIDQKKIFGYSREYSKKLGNLINNKNSVNNKNYKQHIYLMTEM